MYSSKLFTIKNTAFIISSIFFALALTACGNSEDAEKIKAALDINTLNITSLEVLSPRTIMEINATEPFTAEAIIGNDTLERIDISNKVKWSSSNTANAIINSSGSLTGKATESVTVTVTAQLADLSASKDIRLSNAPLESINILDNPSPVSVCRGNYQINAEGSYENEVETRPITDLVTWTSDKPDILTIDETGIFSTFKNGTAVVTASNNGIQNTATIIVNDDLASIAISANSDTVNIGDTLRFTATGTYDDATTDGITNNINWVSDTPDALSISNDAAAKGVATGISVDSANISATCLSTRAITSNSVLIDVEEAPVISGVSINEGTNYLKFKINDNDQQLTARLTRSDGSFSSFVTDDDDIQWSVTRTISGTPLTVSDIKGSKGEISFSAIGVTEIEVRYRDNDANLGPFDDVIEIEIVAN